MLEELKKIADSLIEINKNNPKELKKYQIIKQILNRKDCFLNMDINYAYTILKDLKIPNEKLKKAYIQLIDIESDK